jgi:hypothetical protein
MSKKPTEVFPRPDYVPDWAPEPSPDADEFSLPEGPGLEPPWCPDRLSPPI